MPNTTSEAPMIEARDVRKRFGANEVLRGVSLQVRKGEVVETGAAEEIYSAPKADYTRMLLKAVPRIDAERAVGVDGDGRRGVDDHAAAADGRQPLDVIQLVAVAAEGDRVIASAGVDVGTGDSGAGHGHFPSGIP